MKWLPQVLVTNVAESKNHSELVSGSKKRAAALLNQQIWCWGQDIEYFDCNLLVQYGFRRIENLEKSNSASLYRLDIAQTARIILRGFGVFYGDCRWGGLFLRRFEFTPKLTPQPDLEQPPWSVGDLPLLVSPSVDQLSHCHLLLLTLMDWIREYEVWIANRVGIEYRQKTLIDWKPEGEEVVAGEEMSVAWRMLGVHFSDNPAVFLPFPHEGH